MSDEKPTIDRQSRALAGCCGFGESRRNYFRRLRLVEVQDTFFMPPQNKTLTRWRQDGGDDFVFVIKAWQLITHEADAKGYRRLARDFSVDSKQCGRFQNTEEVATAYARTADAADILRASAILFETPPSFTPTQDNRSKIAAFFERIDRRGRKMIWDARGVWSSTEVVSIATDLDLIPCSDLAQAPLSTKASYVRILGGRHSEETLYRLVDVLADVESAYCLFNTINMFRDALRLQSFFDSTDLD